MEKPLKILILEDMADDVGLMKRILKREGIPFTIAVADTREEFVEALQHFEPDVVLSDHALPQFNSIEALKICQDLNHRIPFILVTGAVSEEFAVECLKQGADDYVLKSNLVRLPSAILNSIKQRNTENQKNQADDHLRKQNSELLKINMELDTFMYNVSHNLRSPLASVLGLIHLAKKKEVTRAELPEYLEMIELSIQKLDNTLNDILEYSQNNRNNINAEEINFLSLIEECFTKLGYLQGSGEVEKEIVIDGDALFKSDFHRISVLFTNLISNAIKFRDLNKEKQRVSISIKLSDQQAVILFRDNGIGIEEQFLPRIFDMFYRASERSEGAGLGLYIVKEIVHVLNGTLSLSSKVEEGTSFTITLPNLRVQ